MKHGFIRVGAATPKVKVADCEYNANHIIELINEAIAKDIKVLIFPELCITSYTCEDLFFQDILLISARNQLIRIVEHTRNSDIVIAVGLPFMKDNKLYNVAAIIQNGKLLGLIPKSNIPNYTEFYEARHFAIGNTEPEFIDFNQDKVLFGSSLLFQCTNMPRFILGVEICEDIWIPIPPSSKHVQAGATLIANLSASNELTGKGDYRRDLVKNQSAKLICGYIYASAGDGESTTDSVYSGHNLVCENGTILRESEQFSTGIIYSEIDLNKLGNERRRMTTFLPSGSENYKKVEFQFHKSRENNCDDQSIDIITPLTRKIEKAPFVPNKKEDREKRCKEIINIQAYGLKKRLEHTNCKCAVIGISGGLDSTLALLVSVKAFDLLKIDRRNIIAITMPCFGTTDRTYQNAVSLTEKLGVTLKEIPINEAVLLHFRDINHDVEVHDITYENAQARERTQILMNVANKYNGMVIGTGDMSELALGWATYNGDHMSMYGVNCSVPKTLVRYLVLFFAETSENDELKRILFDILDTPVSPELLPPKDGVISQKTEDIVGPYELHDFFLYYIVRFGFEPSKVFRLAIYAFDGDYDKKTIYKWLVTFYKRFFSQQFKRSCLPDGPKVGSVALSPRGDLRMPSDANVSHWLSDLEKLSDHL